jgi:hypothetical protein
MKFGPAIFLIGRVCGVKDPITAPYVLPPSNYSSAYTIPVSTPSSSQQTRVLSMVKSPTSTQSDVSYTTDIQTTAYQASSSSGSSSSSGNSVTAQAVVNGMDLQTCATKVKETSTQYTVFDNAMTSMAEQVRQSKLRLDAVDILTHNIQVNQDNFETELSRLKDLYNTLAIRSNALGKWMADEKLIRDNLQELYREMVAKNTEEKARLLDMTSNMRTAVKRLVSIQDETSGILASVASAQTAMYDWAVNVTVAVNTHTTKMESLQAALGYRITQIDHVIPEMLNMAKRTIFIARSLGETNLAYAAANVMTHIDSVLNAATNAQSIMSFPTR